eukprot:1157891-Pelagomonas_calceolata.AAC.2
MRAVRVTSRTAAWHGAACRPFGKILASLPARQPFHMLTACFAKKKKKEGRGPAKFFLMALKKVHCPALGEVIQNVLEPLAQAAEEAAEAELREVSKTADTLADKVRSQWGVTISKGAKWGSFHANFALRMPALHAVQLLPRRGCPILCCMISGRVTGASH